MAKFSRTPGRSIVLMKEVGVTLETAITLQVNELEVTGSQLDFIKNSLVT